jgi:alpha/beta superfamily hydrolase
MSHPASRSESMQGAAGLMELVVDEPSHPPRGIVVVAHPQPLLGGSALHKVPHLLARSLRDAGWLAVRPNFRGVGASEGVHAEGIGETDDILILAGGLRRAHPGIALALMGFSFGAFVQARAARRLADAGAAADRVVLAGLPVGEVEGQRHYATGAAPPDTLVVHGENDDRVPLSAVLDWARPQSHPVVVIPGADHFFTGRLPVLRSLTLAHLATAIGEAR